MIKFDGIKRIYLLYFLLFLGAILWSEYAFTFFSVIIVINTLYTLCNKNADVAIYSSVLIGNELLCITNLILCSSIYIIKKGNIRGIALKCKKEVIIGFLIIFGSSIINGILNGTVINAVFYIAYIDLLLFTYIISKTTFSSGRLLEIVKLSIILEFAITLALLLKHQTLTPNDQYFGTLRNAHFLGNWCILTLIFYLSIRPRKHKSIIAISSLQDFTYIAMVLCTLYLTEAKGMEIALLIAVIVHMVVSSITKRKYSLFILIIFFYCAVGVGLYLLQLSYIQDWLNNVIPLWSVYLYKSGWNGKYQYMYGTYFESLKGLRLFFGYGLGQYGSRIANAFAYDVMWRANNGINELIADIFKPSHVEAYVKYVSYYNRSFVDAIGWRSAVLSYPFSSFIALLGETGLVGVFLFAKGINKIFMGIKESAKFLIVYFFSICLVDIYFDDYQCILPLIIYLSSIFMINSKNTENVSR